jgi:hypothetical protein
MDFKVFFTVLFAFYINLNAAEITEFYLGRLRNKGNGSLLTLIIANNESSITAWLTIETLYTMLYDETIPPQSVIELSIPDNLTVHDNTQHDKGIYIRANVTVVITALSQNGNSSDAYQIYSLLQPKSDQYIYYGITPGDSAVYKRQILLVATENDTVININTSIVSNSHLESSFVLSKLHTYLLDSLTTDLTGIQITANKPLFVASGHECSGHIIDECSFTAEQILPTHIWGHQYILSPIINDTNQEHIVLTSVPNATLIYSCGGHVVFNVTLNNEGDWYNGNLSRPCLILSDVPVIVVLVNPLMVLIPPIEQYRYNVSLGFPTCNSVNHILILLHVTNYTAGSVFYNDSQVNERSLYYISNESALIYMDVTPVDSNMIHRIASLDFTMAAIIYSNSSQCMYSYSMGWIFTKSKVSDVTFGASSYPIFEYEREVIIEIYRTSQSNLKSSVLFTMNDNISHTNADIQYSSKLITFESGETTKSIQFKIIDDDAFEITKNIRFSLIPILQSFIRPINETVLSIIDDDSLTVGLIGMTYDSETNLLSIESGITNGTLAPDQSISLDVLLQDDIQIGIVSLSYIVVMQVVKINISKLLHGNDTISSLSTINARLIASPSYNIIVHPSKINESIENIATGTCGYVVGEFTEQSLIISSCVAGVLLLICVIASCFSIIACGVGYQSRRKWILGGKQMYSNFQDDAISLATNNPETYELMAKLGERKTAMLPINDDKEYLYV